jgi:hypothetical protein
MLKKMVSLVMVVAITLVGPVILVGCADKDEIRVERRTEIKDVQVHQDTVVK